MSEHQGTVNASDGTDNCPEIICSPCFQLGNRGCGILQRKKVISIGIYSQVKDQVTARDAAVHYGFKVNRGGMMKCPFHSDSNPSMKVDKNFICFGCGEKGDVIRFAARLFGLTEYEAAWKLIRDMDLEVGKGSEPAAKQYPRREEQDKETDDEQHENEVNRVCRILLEYLHLLGRWKTEYAPHSPTEDFHLLFVEAAQKKEYVEYLLDLLLYGSEEEKSLVLIEKGEEVNDLERRIREYHASGGDCPF